MDFSNHSKGITSVKVHHQPGGASNFSLAHDQHDDRFAKPGNFNAFTGGHQRSGDKFHQRTGEKNRSQIAFGNEQDDNVNRSSGKGGR